jgi:hypothetical protein
VVRKINIDECVEAVQQALSSKGLTVHPWLLKHRAWVRQAALTLAHSKSAGLEQAAAGAGAAEAALAPGLPTEEQQSGEGFSSGKVQHEQAADHAAALGAADTEAVRAAGECAGDDHLDLDKLLDAAVAQQGRQQQQQQQHTQVAEQEQQQQRTKTIERQQQQHEEGLKAQPEVEQGQEQQVPYASTTSPAAACGSQAAITPPAVDDPAFEQQILRVLQGLYAL